jgi:hypothetical protein
MAAEEKYKKTMLILNPIAIRWAIEFILFENQTTMNVRSLDMGGWFTCKINLRRLKRWFDRHGCDVCEIPIFQVVLNDSSVPVKKITEKNINKISFPACL